MTKFQKSVSLGLCAAVMLGMCQLGTNKNTQNLTLLFPSLSLGWSSELSSKKSEDKIAEVDKNEDVSYSFKILDIIAELFG